MTAGITIATSFNYVPEVREVPGVPNHHPIKKACDPCSRNKVMCRGHNGRSQPCNKCKVSPGVECFFTRSKKSSRKENNAAALAIPSPNASCRVIAPGPAAAPLPTLANAANTFPDPTGIDFAPVGVPAPDFSVNLDSWASEYPPASAASAPLIPAQQQQPLCAAHRGLFTEPLELAVLASDPDKSQTTETVRALLHRYKGAIRSLVAVLSCKKCSSRREVVWAAAEMVLGLGSGFADAVPRLLRDVWLEPTENTFVLVRQSQRGAEQLATFGDRVGCLLAPHDLAKTIEIGLRMDDVRRAAVLLRQRSRRNRKNLRKFSHRLFKGVVCE
ncbi:hypothetical protein C7999DRAFT_30175 [Corynascus novoguineensis]|uniref:Zn(2)-C6 fungal-type domain-containing protein n=1 Tax=Corynascus novoguineensis TaxID=1126955 RepID=A0AAN7CWE1_9PEZI|nr:hypothetical protein C7999DRAFT_30175 [Corynascus novoguineensis]